MAVSNDIFERIGGMNNNFWGWDVEDKEFMILLKRNKIKIKHQSKHIGTSYQDSFLSLHNNILRRRDYLKCNNQSTNSSKIRDNSEGVEHTKFRYLDIQEMLIDGFNATFINVELFCDFQVTPWCDCSRKV